MARSRGPIYIADNSVVAINDALQQILFMLDEVKGEHDNTVVIIGPHTHGSGDQTGGPIALPDIDHDDLLNVTSDQHHAKLHQATHNEGGIDELKLDDTGNPDDNSDNNATTLAHGLLPKLSGNVNEVLRGDGTYGTVSAVEATDVANVEGSAQEQIWEQVIAGTNITITELANGNAIQIDASGSSSGGASMWHPDFAPASPGSEDDEFADNSGGLPGGWTDWDHGSVETNVENKAGVLQTITASGVLGGMYKAIPAGDFTIWTKFNRLDYASQHIGALILLEDGANSAGDLYTLGMDTSSFNLAVYSWNAYNSFGGITSGGGASYDVKSVYFRIRRTGTTYAFDYSYNGILWVQRVSTTIGFTPLHFGIGVYGTGGVPLRANFQFFRYVASDIGVDGIAEGNRS